MILDQTNLDGGELRIIWDILEQNDGGVVRLILAGDTETSITANAVIEGQKNISTIRSLEEKRELRDRLAIMLVMTLMVIWVIYLGFLFIHARILSSEDN